MAAQWQINQNGTHYADYLGKWISVQRTAPRKREFAAKIEGKLLGTFASWEVARSCAELGSEQRVQRAVNHTQHPAA